MIDTVIAVLLGVGLGYVAARIVNRDLRIEGRLALQESVSLRHGKDIKMLEARLDRHLDAERRDRVYTDAEPRIIIEEEGRP